MAYVEQGGFSSRISGLLGEVDYRVVGQGEDLEEIFRLRYEAYRREDAISPNVKQTFQDTYDESDNGWIIGVYVDDVLAGSVRIHLADHVNADFPSLHTFPDFLEPALHSGSVIVDSTRFVIDKERSRQFKGLPFVTLRLCWMAVEHFKADHFLAAIRSEHQAFYKRTFRHRAVCPPRAYAMLNCPIALMSVSYLDAVDWVYGRYPFFRSNVFERRMLFDRHQNIDRDERPVAIFSDEARSIQDPTRQ